MRIHILEVPISDEDYDLYSLLDDSYSIDISENFEDVLEFEFSKKYGYKWDSKSCWLEKDYEQFYRDMKKKWKEDLLSINDMYETNEEFREFLASKYYQDVLTIAVEDAVLASDDYIEDIDD